MDQIDDGHVNNLIAEFLKDRSERNFLRIYALFKTDLYHIALSLLNYHTEEAEDVLQETWIVAVRKLETFERRSQFKTWLIAILINKCRERYRQNEPVRSTQEINPAEAGVIELSWINIDIKAALKNMAAGYREVFILHDVKGYKHQEIAQLLNINEGTSKSQLFHARKILQEFLKA